MWAIGACPPRTRAQTKGASVRGQLGRFSTLSSHIFDSGGAPLYPRVHEEKKTGTITRRSYPGYPSAYVRYRTPLSLPRDDEVMYQATGYTRPLVFVSISGLPTDWAEGRMAIWLVSIRSRLEQRYTRLYRNLPTAIYIPYNVANDNRYFSPEVLSMAKMC